MRAVCAANTLERGQGLRLESFPKQGAPAQNPAMTKKRFPVHPANPERLCWGCDKYCSADDMMCGNGSDRTQHPVELFGENWRDWGGDFEAPDAGVAATAERVAVDPAGV